jgi:hypothetical protein
LLFWVEEGSFRLRQQVPSKHPVEFLNWKVFWKLLRHFGNGARWTKEKKFVVRKKYFTA